MTRRWASRGEGGTAAVEMALVLPLVAVLVFGFVDLGRAYRLKTSLTNAAHEGAAYARYNPTQVASIGECADPNNVVYAAQNEEASPNGFAVTVMYTLQPTETPPATWSPLTGCNTAVSPTRVRVTASAPFTLMTPLIAALVGRSITLSETSEVLVQ